MRPDKRVRWGIIGCGRFAGISLDAYRDLPLIELAAVCDSDPAAARTFGEKAGLSEDRVFTEPVKLMDAGLVDAVHILTPPASHVPLAVTAIEKGIHVFCEKPLAVSAAEAEIVIRRAADRKVRVGVDYVMRHCPCVSALGALIRDGLMGDPTHYLLENHAQDETLPPEHWFWDRGQSGGILLEHGVHFFDAARSLLGEGELTGAGCAERPGSGQIDRVWAAVLFAKRVPAFFMHAFDRPDIVERAWTEIVFERGYLALRGWIPTVLEGEAYVSSDEKGGLEALLGAGSVEVIDTLDPAERRGGGRTHRFDTRVKLRYEPEPDRWKVYRAAVRAGVEDFARAALDPGHTPRVTAEDAAASLRLAEEATRKALA